jgi:hypothetical protein
MSKTFFLLFIIFSLNGCAQSIALLGTSASGASSGKIIQSSVNSVTSYGIKKHTGKTPLGHALAYAEKVNPEKKKEPCLSFIEKTNSEICVIMKKQMNLTKTKLMNNKKHNKSAKDFSSSLQSNIDMKSKIEYLD